MAHMRKSMQDFGVGFRVKFLTAIHVVPSSLDRGKGVLLIYHLVERTFS